MDATLFNRRILIFEGIIFLILGILALILPGLFTLGIELMIGWLLIIGGFVQGYRSLKSRHAPGFWPSILSAILYILVGGLLVLYPLSGMITLTILLAAFFVIEGIAKIFLGFQLRNFPSWGWIVFSGFASLAMAVIIWAGWPLTAIWVIGLLVGINLLFAGLAQLFLAWNMSTPTH